MVRTTRVTSKKSSGDFAGARLGDGDGDAHQYFFGSADELPDGEEGPLAYAASGDDPRLGVYDATKLKELGFEDGSVVATPDQIRDALVLEFLPQYRR